MTGTNLPLGSTETFFLSTVYFEGNPVVENIRTRLVTNRLTYSEPRLTLFPSEDEYRRLSTTFELEIKGYTKYIDQEKSGEIHIPKGYRSHAHKKPLDTAWTEYLIEVEPSELYQKRYLKTKPEDNKAIVTFFLTSNEAATPLGGLEYSFTGDVKKDVVRKIVLSLDDGWKAQFEEHYNYADTRIENMQGNFSSHQLVITLEKEDHLLDSLDEVRQLSKAIDRLLLYLSFGSRQRVTWIRWTGIVQTELIEYHRLFYQPSQLSKDEELVERKVIQDFLQHCLDQERTGKSLNLSLPLVLLLATERTYTVEAKFLGFYTALEALLHVYAKSRGINKHFDSTVWRTFCHEMRDAINGLGFITPDDKTVMLGKLGMFNQPSSKLLYEKFCREFRIDNSDLWPLTQGAPSLLDVRNELTHGRKTDNLLIDYAEQHLQWTVERCLLGALQWKDASGVTPESLGRYSDYQAWKKYLTKVNVAYSKDECNGRKE
jgi:hypothetical protein